MPILVLWSEIQTRFARAVLLSLIKSKHRVRKTTGHVCRRTRSCRLLIATHHRGASLSRKLGLRLLHSAHLPHHLSRELLLSRVSKALLPKLLLAPSLRSELLYSTRGVSAKTWLVSKLLLRRLLQRCSLALLTELLTHRVNELLSRVDKTLPRAHLLTAILPSGYPALVSVARQVAELAELGGGEVPASHWLVYHGAVTHARASKPCAIPLVTHPPGTVALEAACTCLLLRLLLALLPAIHCELDLDVAGLHMGGITKVS